MLRAGNMYRTKTKITLPNGKQGYYFYLIVKGTNKMFQVFAETIKAGRNALKKEKEDRNIPDELIVKDIPKEDYFIVKL